MRTESMRTLYGETEIQLEGQYLVDRLPYLGNVSSLGYIKIKLRQNISNVVNCRYKRVNLGNISVRCIMKFSSRAARKLGDHSPGTSSILFLK